MVFILVGLVDTSNLLNLIQEYKKSDNGKEYSTADTYLKFYNDLMNVSGNKIKKVTLSIAEYLAYGDKNSLKGNALTDKIREGLFNLLLEKRKQLFPEYNTSKLRDFLDYLETDLGGGYSYAEDIVRDIIETLGHPEYVGLPEYSEHNTIRKEISSYLTLLNKKGKREHDAFQKGEPLDTKLRNILKESGVL